jgi:hypothetical protein
VAHHHHHRDPGLDRLRHKIIANRKGRRRGWHKRTLFLQHLITQRVARRHGLNAIVIFDGVPCSAGTKLELIDCAQHGWPGVLVSCDRRDNPHTTRLLHRLNLHTQEELIALGYPANPVRLSSHCGFSDGISYPDIPPEHHLPHTWMLGRDVTYWDSLLAVSNHLGYPLVQPYPASNEAHHVQPRSDPKHQLIERGRV